ncbi:site-specific DNA-methyltransferase [Verminephrobacter aporrectodeae subsp. tuberculatae]|uniref:site-specific DNA-methyltransferase (adenine-specific) n=1 Tax=Verminephrobacter aporrectodeae subsp. tuberculatae TaxID=1110392 RepID=A0ABT3KVU5_9BURK|nr:site-specific DNA-methyltransferase [Verminephrobacter aporrectodeae]MCW5322455.1 site-specific DNA-methyltransferase [Verminephrobacter aporrectodeae subsp. tuberculatae]MCW8165123.1 site-specific DNA-methyltransferase [Verminephrobacter aporrectodeae subsp. tuberculatae]MCW8168511.1 site-specific DNA-methyltransferase [Verminephrobacter aporrectodeae subsp. tuberculatae]
MKKLKMHSLNLAQENVIRILELFPNCVTEAQDSGGRVKLTVDFDQLRQELSDSIVEGPQERYHLNWPGKREAMLAANAPIAKTLRPCRKESVDFDKTQNLFIEGDNLNALKLLQETYLGKVKLIYIDPPYNTGNDFIYKDNFAESIETYKLHSNQEDASGNRLIANSDSSGRFHSAWLSMIFSRLKVARNLLSEDGLIIISIDSGEAANLRILMDEVFGARNFIGLLPTVMNLKGNNDAFAFSDTHEFTIIYAKSRFNCIVNELPIDEDKLDDWEEDERGLFKRADTLRRTGQDAARERRPNGWFPVFISRDQKVYVTEDDRPNSIDDVELWPKNDDGDELSWTWGKKKINEQPFNLLVIQGRNGLNIYKKQRPGFGDLPTSKPKSILYKPEYSSSNGTAELTELLGKNVFDSPPKPRALLRDLITLGACKDSIILDFFSGTGTTAHAAVALNALDGGRRRFIMVQLDAPCDSDSSAAKAGYKTIAEITKERIRRAGQTILSGPSHDEWNKDVGFRVLKIDTANMADVYYAPNTLDKGQIDLLVDNIKPDRIPEDLLFQVMLDWGVDLTLPIARRPIRGKDVYFVDGNVLVACFDEHSGIDEDFVKELAKHQPLRVVFRDAGFKNSAVKINVEQIFKLLSPATEVKCI